MSTFQLQDAFGFKGSITPASGALSKYFQNLPDMMVSGINLQQLGTTLMSSPPVTSVTGNLTFNQPIDIGTSAVELKLGAGVGGTLAIFVPSKAGAPLFNPDLFGDNIAVNISDRYVSMKLSPTISVNVSASPGDLTFGFKGSSSVTLASYQLFTSGQETLWDAVQKTIAGFVIAADLDDIAGMPEGSIATGEGTGDLKFSGSVNLLSITNPLASLTLPVGGTLKVTGGAKITVGASYEFSGDYQVRVQKLAGKVFRLGFYRKRDSVFSISASASASLSPTLGSNDLFVDLMKAISADPTADMKALEAAGLSNDQVQDIQKALKNAIDRSLAVGASLELSRGDAAAAMFLYEVDLGAIQADGRALLHSALEGDLSGIVSADDNLPAGIKVIKTLVSKTKTFQHSLKINLLGIYNFLQISSLIINGKTAWDATTGEFVITDQITASKIGISTSNLQADTKKLRQVLAERFLITAAYRAIPKVVDSGPALTGTQSYFEMQANASRSQVQKELLVSAALGLESEDDAVKKLPASLEQFGPTTVYAEMTYDDPAFHSLFLDQGQLRDISEYIDAGRRAINFIVQPGDSDEARLKLAQDDVFFAKLSSIGSVTSAVFKETLEENGIPDSLAVTVGDDYLAIQFLSGALNSAGQKLLAIEQFLATNPNVDPGNHDFGKLRSDLANKLGDVAQHATENFGGPWGFNAMGLLRRSATQKWLLMNAHVAGVLEAGKPLAAAALGTR